MLAPSGHFGGFTQPRDYLFWKPCELPEWLKRLPRTPAGGRRLWLTPRRASGARSSSASPPAPLNEHETNFTSRNGWIWHQMYFWLWNQRGREIHSLRLEKRTLRWKILLPLPAQISDLILRMRWWWWEDKLNFMYRVIHRVWTELLLTLQYELRLTVSTQYKIATQNWTSTKALSRPHE